MLKSLRIFSFSLLICLSYANGYSQNYLGTVTSNYSGIMGNDLNPASFVDGRFSFDLNLFSTNLNLYQNFGYFDADYMRKLQKDQFGKSYWWTKSFGDTAIFNAWGSGPFEQFNNEPFSEGIIKHIYDTLTESPRGINMNYQLDLINFGFHVTPKISVGFNAKLRSITNLDNMDPKLAVLAESGLDTNDLWGRELPEELLNLNHMTWSEYGFNYGQVILDQGKHFLKIGGDIKYMQGYSAAYVYTDNFNYGLVDEDTSFILQGDFAYGYSDNFDKLVEGNIEMNSFGLPKASSKSGYGLDIGIVYEWRPKFEKYKFDMDGQTNLWMKNKNKYELRVGASLLDLGALRFQKGGLSRDFSVDINRKFDLNQFESATSLTGFDQIIDSLIYQSLNPNEWTAGAKDTTSTFWVQTPSAFSLQLDYHIWKYFYVNATGMLNLISQKRQAKVKVPNQFSITPSFDYAWFGIHVPISINEYSGFKTGLATRLGPVTFGLTDFRTLFARGKVRGIDIYAGFRVPILYDAVKDLDGDKVSDKMDACFEVPGLWSFRGCPDTDGDGIMDGEDDCPLDYGSIEFRGCPDKDGDKIIDKNDSCPEVAGLKDFSGCPDSDGDKIIDKNDSCPNIAGLKEFFGCPDTDKDGITDHKDDCPTQYGLAQFNGCPDKDGDGIRDIEDGCPDVSGPPELNGCPDTDKDGILDYLDGCPKEKGPKENNGCPWPDTDKDGLLDKDDECPSISGPISNKGCPYKDTDGDGLLDKDDACPNTYGPVSNNGCPVIEKEVEEVLKTAFDNLEFETLKDNIRENSFKSLDELAEVLTKRPKWYLHISGHTDNGGDEQSNLILSKKRAESLKAYLVLKGVNENQLKVFYFGETKPIATNDTPEGRQKNRRVEMEIKFD
jgi:outer membrane protein OmpA-like peptidoglycan-associated protein